ncbi:hypothetical protein ACSQ67_021164 [Phaseolus vulgaris]
MRGGGARRQPLAPVGSSVGPMLVDGPTSSRMLRCSTMMKFAHINGEEAVACGKHLSYSSTPMQSESSKVLQELIVAAEVLNPSPGIPQFPYHYEAGVEVGCGLYVALLLVRVQKHSSQGQGAATNIEIFAVSCLMHKFEGLGPYCLEDA